MRDPVWLAGRHEIRDKAPGPRLGTCQLAGDEVALPVNEEARGFRNELVATLPQAFGDPT